MTNPSQVTIKDRKNCAETIASSADETDQYSYLTHQLDILLQRPFTSRPDLTALLDHTKHDRRILQQLINHALCHLNDVREKLSQLLAHAQRYAESESWVTPEVPPWTEFIQMTRQDMVKYVERIVGKVYEVDRECERLRRDVLSGLIAD